MTNVYSLCKPIICFQKTVFPSNANIISLPLSPARPCHLQHKSIFVRYMYRTYVTETLTYSSLGLCSDRHCLFYFRTEMNSACAQRSGNHHSCSRTVLKESDSPYLATANKCFMDVPSKVFISNDKIHYSVMMSWEQASSSLWFC